MAKVFSDISSQDPRVQHSVILVVALVLFAAAPFSIAQVSIEIAQVATVQPPTTEATLTLPESSSLPDSPGAFVTGSSTSTAEEPADSADPITTTRPVLRPQVKLVPSDRTAPPQTAGDKVKMGLREAVTPYSMLGWVFSAGWAQLIDGSPNYGTNGKAFAQRLGASAAIASSRNIFSDSILGPIFHQDTRYYQLGKGHNFIHRAIYAGTRPIIGRTDGGRSIPNYAFLLATGGSSGLTVTYYPEQNTSASEVGWTFATSLGGAAVGNLISEFGGDIIQSLHLTRNQ